MTDKMKIYISGKMRGLPEEESRMKFEAARQYLFDQGHDAVNPWDSEKKKEEQCSEWSEYILYDLQIIKDCDALYMLNNWQDSNGAKCEHAFAKGMGMDIFYEPQEPDGESLEAEFDRYIKKIAPTSIISGTIDLRDMAHHFVNWQKEQMMKEVITAHCFGFQSEEALFSFKQPAGPYLVGSVLKVIIIKED